MARPRPGKRAKARAVQPLSPPGTVRLLPMNSRLVTASPTRRASGKWSAARALHPAARARMHTSSAWARLASRRCGRGAHSSISRWSRP